MPSEMGTILKILILGGAGFVGKALLQHIGYLNASPQIVVVDRDSKRISELDGIYTTECFDITNLSKLNGLFENHDFSHVFHLAANSDIKSGSISESADFQDTLKTSVALAEILRFHQIDTLFFSSSSAVYGEIDGALNSNRKRLRYPISNYGWAKLASEMILHQSSQVNNFRFINMRFPNVVGQNPTHGLLFDIKAKLETDPKNLKVLGDGSQDKPYIDVEELVSIIIRLVLESDSFNGDCNIGPKDTITVKRIIEIVLELSELSPVVDWGSEPVGWPGDVRKYSYDENLPRECEDLFISSSEVAIRKAVEKLWKG